MRINEHTNTTHNTDTGRILCSNKCHTIHCKLLFKEMGYNKRITVEGLLRQNRNSLSMNNAIFHCTVIIKEFLTILREKTPYKFISVVHS